MRCSFLFVIAELASLSSSIHYWCLWHVYCLLLVHWSHLMDAGLFKSRNSLPLVWRLTPNSTLISVVTYHYMAYCKGTGKQQRSVHDVITCCALWVSCKFSYFSDCLDKKSIEDLLDGLNINGLDRDSINKLIQVCFVSVCAQYFLPALFKLTIMLNVETIVSLVFFNKHTSIGWHWHHRMLGPYRCSYT